jgi:hypothetical protein
VPFAHDTVRTAQAAARAADLAPIIAALQAAGVTSLRMLAPGAIFRPHLESSPWMRFNVTVCEDTRVQRWLQAVCSRTS